MEAVGFEAQIIISNCPGQIGAGYILMLDCQTLLTLLTSLLNKED